MLRVVRRSPRLPLRVRGEAHRYAVAVPADMAVATRQHRRRQLQGLAESQAPTSLAVAVLPEPTAQAFRMAEQAERAVAEIRLLVARAVAVEDPRRWLLAQEETVARAVFAVAVAVAVASA